MELHLSSHLAVSPYFPSLAKNFRYLAARFRPPPRPAAAVVAGASNYSGYCEFSSLNTPVEPRTPAGRFLSGVLLNDRRRFHGAVAEALEKLVEELDGACARRALIAGSGEACLHRRIAELKSRECQTVVEDVMYLLILYKFSEIRVHLIPRLSQCMYNSRLEILPSKDWELESIHTFEIFEMIKQHLTSVTGWKPDFNVTENWALTKVTRVHLCRIYTSSILFGYFLKSAALRYQLEMSLVGPIDDVILKREKLRSCRQKNIAFSRISVSGHSKKREKLSAYLMGFAPESIVKCAQPNSKEALSLITKHCCALFGDDLVESDETISTSFSSLKRFVLEAIAFGSFLWDTEEYVKTVYNLEEIK